MPDNKEIKKTAGKVEMKGEEISDEILDQINGGLVVRRERDPEPTNGKLHMRGSVTPQPHIMI